LATASSKEELAAWTVKYKESCRLPDDAIEERQDYGKAKEETMQHVLICGKLASAL